MTQDQVEKFISQYLNQATRHNFENLTIRDFKSFDCEMNVEVAHTIHIKAIEDTSREPKGELLTKGDYENMIKTIKRDESANPDWTNKLEAHIRECCYGDYYTQDRYIESLSIWFFCSLPQCFSYQKPCHKCGGKGSATCNDCKGKGQIKCSSCSGRRRIKCSKCSGQGRLKKTRYKLNGEKYIAFDECSSCKGYGTVVCSKCDAHGVVDCSKCKSSGIVNCSSCYATGRITTNVEFAAYVDTKYYIKIISENQAFDADKILQEIPKAKLNQGEHERLELAQSEQGVKEQYKITLPVAQCTIELDSKPFAWSFYGREIQLASDDHCVSYILQADVENLQKTARFCYLKPFILWQAKSPLRTFLQSPANHAMLTDSALDLFKTLRKSKSTAKTELNKSGWELPFSIDYFMDSIASIFAITRAYVLFSVSFWLTLSIACMYLCLVMDKEIVEFFDSHKQIPYIHIFILVPSLLLIIGYFWRNAMIRIMWGKEMAHFARSALAFNGNGFKWGLVGLAWCAIQVVWYFI